jgi:hypothetical protein
MRGGNNNEGWTDERNGEKVSNEKKNSNLFFWLKYQLWLVPTQNAKKDFKHFCTPPRNNTIKRNVSLKKIVLFQLPKF